MDRVGPVDGGQPVIVMAGLTMPSSCRSKAWNVSASWSPVNRWVISGVASSRPAAITADADELGRVHDGVGAARRLDDPVRSSAGEFGDRRRDVLAGRVERRGRAERLGELAPVRQRTRRRAVRPARTRRPASLRRARAPPAAPRLAPGRWSRARSRPLRRTASARRHLAGRCSRPGR
jgi:hypothetical protein